MYKFCGKLLLAFWFLGCGTYAANNASPSVAFPADQARARAELEGQLRGIRKLVEDHIVACKQMDEECRKHLDQEALDKQDEKFQSKWRQRKTILGYKLEAIASYITSAKETLPLLTSEEEREEISRELHGLQEKLLPWLRYKKLMCYSEFPSSPRLGGPNKRKGANVNWPKGDGLKREHAIPHRDDAGKVYL